MAVAQKWMQLSHTGYERKIEIETMINIKAVMVLINKIRFMMNQYRVKRYWKATNQHNSTWLGAIGNQMFIDFVQRGGLSVGKYTYGKLNINYTGNKNERLIIGDYCSIATTCLFILGGEHDYRCVSTFPLISRIGKYGTEVLTKGQIVVDDEVWIGDHAIIMSGVHIGKGAVIAAGSIVTHDVEPYSIVGGNPAKLIRFRFSESIIKKLMNIKLAVDGVDDELKDCLVTRVTEGNVNEIIERLKRLGAISDAREQ